MAGFLDIDATEVRMLEADLRRAPFRVQIGATKTLRRAAELIDSGMRADATGHRHLAGLPNAVSHEMIDAQTAEIGLSPGGQGSLAHIIAYGSVNNAPVYDHTTALRRATPAVARMFADMGAEAVLGDSR